MEDSIRFAKKYVEDMLSFFGLNTDISATHEDDVIELSIPSTYLNGFLIGQQGETLRAIQFLTSAALRSNKLEYNRINLDVADYKKHRQDRLAEEAETWVAQVRTTKKPMDLKPMSPADRRVVHKVVGEYPDLSSDSVGYGRDRHIVIAVVEEKKEPKAAKEPKKNKK